MPIRTCVGCRAKAEQILMIRWSCVDNHSDVLEQIIIRASLCAPGKLRSGRGAWMHLKLSCLHSACKKGALTRALKIAKTSIIDEESFHMLIHEEGSNSDNI